MRTNKKKDLSVLKWVEDLFSDISFLTISDEYDEENEELDIPTVALSTGDMNSRPIQMGDRTQVDFRIFYFDIYAKNKAQRNDLVYEIYEEIDAGIPVYDYDEGYDSPSRIGTISVLEKNNKPIEVVPELVEKMYYRSQITIYTDYSRIQ
jgi:hypothetical protein